MLPRACPRQDGGDLAELALLTPIVMADGLISEIGTHEQLLKSSGAYARLHKAMMEVSNV